MTKFQDKFILAMIDFLTNEKGYSYTNRAIQDILQILSKNDGKDVLSFYVYLNGNLMFSESIDVNNDTEEDSSDDSFFFDQEVLNLVGEAKEVLPSVIRNENDLVQHNLVKFLNNALDLLERENITFDEYKNLRNAFINTMNMRVKR